jgi:DNA-directed RNA polymerase specialized sigma24 family protein
MSEHQSIQSANAEVLYPMVLRFLKSLDKRFGGHLHDSDLSDVGQDVLMRIISYQRDGFPESLSPLLDAPLHMPVWSITRYEWLDFLRSNNRYRLSGNAEDPDSWMDEMTDAGADLTDGLILQEESAILEEKRRSAQARLAPFVQSILTGSDADTPLRTPRHQPSPMLRQSSSPQAVTDFARAVKALPYSKEHLSKMLGISMRRFRCLERGLTEPDEFLRSNLESLLQEHGGWTWERIFGLVERRTGLSGIPARRWMQAALGVSERTLVRWIQGGYGGAKGLIQASTIIVGQTGEHHG